MNRDALDALIDDLRPVWGSLAEPAVTSVLTALGLDYDRTDDQRTAPPPAGLPDGVDGYRPTGRAA